MFMQSSGGLTGAASFQGKDAILSGPAGGVVGAARVSEIAGQRRIIGFDMGGTSTDVCHFAGEFEPAVDTLGIVAVGETRATPDYAARFAALRTYPAVSRDVARFRRYFDKEPDQRLTLTVQTNSLPLPTVQFMNIDTAYFAPVEWTDGMPDMNWLSTSKQVRWILREDATGKENMNIQWRVKQGSVVKLRIFNDPKSFHPMQHPIHLHGQRMLVVSRDGVRTRNLVWKDTVIIPVGTTVDLLIDASNPGAWMLHCHIAEHLGSDMMAVMHVDAASR